MSYIGALLCNPDHDGQTISIIAEKGKVDPAALRLLEELLAHQKYELVEVDSQLCDSKFTSDLASSTF